MSSESIKNTISLMLITVVAGLLLGLVYEITKTPIANEQQRAKEEAYKAVFENADHFEAITLDEQAVEQELQKQGYNATINEAMKVLDKDGNLLGHVVTVTDRKSVGRERVC